MSEIGHNGNRNGNGGNGRNQSVGPPPPTAVGYMQVAAEAFDDRGRQRKPGERDYENNDAFGQVRWDDEGGVKGFVAFKINPNSRSPVALRRRQFHIVDTMASYAKRYGCDYDGPDLEDGVF